MITTRLSVEIATLTLRSNAINPKELLYHSIIVGETGGQPEIKSHR